MIARSGIRLQSKLTIIIIRDLRRFRSGEQYLSRGCILVIRVVREILDMDFDGGSNGGSIDSLAGRRAVSLNKQVI